MKSSRIVGVIVILLVLVNLIIWPFILKEFKKKEIVSEEVIKEKTDFDILMDYLFDDDVDKVKEILADKKIDLSKIDEGGYQPITVAATMSPLSVLSLLELGADPNYINQLDEFNIPPIGLVAANDLWKSEFYQAAVALLEYGANPNVPDRYGATPIMAAAQYDGSEKMVQLLLDYGANPNCKDIRGETALEKAEGERRDDREGVINLLEKAMKEINGTQGCPQTKLSTEDPIVALKELGYMIHESEFLYAIESDDIYAVKLFLKAGQDPNVKRENGDEVFDDLYWSKQFDMMKVLVKAGANPDVTDHLGVTSLMRASAEGNVELVKTLLTSGADPFKENNSGWNAIKYAESENNYEVMLLLNANKTAGMDYNTNINDEPEFFVTQGRKVVKKFYTPEEAIAFAKTLTDAEVFNPNTSIWDNKPSSVYQGEQLLGSFQSKYEGITFAQNIATVKVVNDKTGYVEWDNYPKECGTCDSPIQDEYNPRGLFDW